MIKLHKNTLELLQEYDNIEICTTKELLDGLTGYEDEDGNYHDWTIGEYIDSPECTVLEGTDNYTVLVHQNGDVSILTDY